MAPTMSSVRVARAGSGVDRTISRTHVDSVAGKPASACGAISPAGDWCHTRNMGPLTRRPTPPHPTFPGQPGLETPVRCRYCCGNRPRTSSAPAGLRRLRDEGDVVAQVAQALDQPGRGAPARDLVEVALAEVVEGF